MNGTGIASTETVAFGDRRVLLAVDDEETRAVLTSWLTEQCTVVAQSDPDVAGTAADAYVLDRPALEAATDALETARGAADPAHLPVLLVASRDETDQSPGRSGLESVPDDLVDDVLTRPLHEPDVKRHVRVLLRLRVLSLQIERRDREFAGLLDLLEEGVFLLENGRVVHANEAALDLLGLPGPEAVFRDRFSSLFDPADRETVEGLFAPSTDGSDRSFESVTLVGESERVPAEVAVSRVEYDGSSSRLAIVRDRREYPRRSRRVELYRDAISAATLGITLLDTARPDTPVVYANEAFTELTGYDAADAIGNDWLFLTGANTDTGTVSTLRAAVEAGDPESARLFCYRADGTPFWNQVHLVPVRDAGDDSSFALALHRDVTDQVERETELERFRTLVEAAGDPIYTLDESGTITHVNDSFVSFIGHSRAELIGSHASMVVDEQDVQTAESVIADMVAADDTSSRTVEVVMETADGDRRLCEVSIGLLPCEGRFQGTVGIVRDVTEPKGREQRLVVLERVLRHNLRNRLNVVLGHSEALQEREDLDQAVETHLTAIDSATRDLVSLCDEVREFRDVVALQREEAMTRDAIDLVETTVADTAAVYEDATITVDLPESAPVRTRGRLGIALEELVENAVAHNDSPSPTVTVSLETTADTVEISVADDGPGIPPDEREAIESGTENPLEHGSGLGLWLVTWTVEQSGGSIAITDNDPRGTVVTLSLPRA